MANPPKKQILETGRIIIVSPTHEDFLFQSKNPKEVYAKAQKDASNFDRMCRLEKDVRLSTYAECSSAFDKDTIILHVERKDLEHLDSLSLVRQLKNENVGVYTISRTDFLHIMFQQMEQNIIQEVWQLFKQVLLKIELSSKMIQLARLLRDSLTEIIQRYEKQQSQQ